VKRRAAGPAGAQGRARGEGAEAPGAAAGGGAEGRGAAPGPSMAVNVAGEALTLLAERAVFWPARASLLVADLHWGKTETFRAHGIALPDGTLGGDLGRLASALDRTHARRVIVLGDLVHHATGITPALVEHIADFRRRRAVEFWLVRGNHDKHSIVFPEAWGLRVIEHELADGPFLLRHEPVPAAGRYVWAGHLHPQVRLVGRGDALTLPCFHLGRDVGVLPAFSEFTGGVLMRRRPGERTFALVEGRVIEVLRPPPAPRRWRLRRCIVRTRRRARASPRGRRGRCARPLRRARGARSGRLWPVRAPWPAARRRRACHAR
jgi:uncharacterized protein